MKQSKTRQESPLLSSHKYLHMPLIKAPHHLSRLLRSSFAKKCPSSFSIPRTSNFPFCPIHSLRTFSTSYRPPRYPFENKSQNITLNLPPFFLILFLKLRILHSACSVIVACGSADAFSLESVRVNFDCIMLFELLLSC